MLNNGEKLILRHQLTVNYGVEYSWTDRIETEENAENNLFDPPISNTKTPIDFTDTLKGDLYALYYDGTLSDMTVKASNKDFPVHKNILGARSKVFKAMFDQDMKENITGVLEIKDIDDDTISRMLLFVYTDILGDMDCDAACKFYFAADMYRIMELRRQCSDFIKKNIDTSNAYDALVLANTHQDEVFETFVKNFILDHASEMIESKEWKMFMKDQLPLASELMHMLCVRNLKR